MGHRKVSRREFLRQTAAAAGAVAGASILNACAPAANAPSPTAAPATAAPQPTVAPQPTSAPTVISSQTNKLTLITSADQQPYWEYLSTQFKEAHPGVEIELIAPAYDQMRTKILSTLASGAALDAFSMDIIWVGEFASQGLTFPLDDTMTQQEKDGFLPGLMAGLSSNGKLMAMPGGAWFKNLFYNTDITKKAGLDAPPKTYEALVEQGKKLQSDGTVKYITGWGWSQAEGLICDWTLLHHAFGGQWFDDKGTWIVNNEQGVKALTYMVDNLKNKVFDPASTTYNDRTAMNPFFVSDYMGVAGWGLFGWNISNDPKESKIPGKVDVGLLYGEDASKVVSATCSGMSGVSVSSNSKSKDLAVDWVRRLAGIGQHENTLQAMKLSGIPPVQAWAWNDPTLLKDNPALPKIAAQAQYMFNRPSASIVKYSDWSSMAQVELSKALTGEKSPKDALDAIAENSNRDYKHI